MKEGMLQFHDLDPHIETWVEDIEDLQHIIGGYLLKLQKEMNEGNVEALSTFVQFKDMMLNLEYKKLSLGLLTNIRNNTLETKDQLIHGTLDVQGYIDVTNLN